MLLGLINTPSTFMTLNEMLEMLLGKFIIIVTYVEEFSEKKEKGGNFNAHKIGIVRH